METLIDEYTKEITESQSFKRLKELKKLIDCNYSKEIVALKTAESKYNEAQGYGAYYPGLDKLKLEYAEAKANLYSKPEVREYFDLEREINKILDSDLNELKLAIFGETEKKSCSCK